MHAIFLTLPGAAFLIERVKFHNAAGKLGVVGSYNVEAETLPADPVNAAFVLIGGFGSEFAGFRVAALPEHITHGTRYALASVETRRHFGGSMPGAGAGIA